MELKNHGSEPIELAWGRFNYTLNPGETQDLAIDVANAFIKRFPNVGPSIKEEPKVEETKIEESAENNSESQVVDTEDTATRKRSRKPS